MIYCLKASDQFIILRIVISSHEVGRYCESNFNAIMKNFKNISAFKYLKYVPLDCNGLFSRSHCLLRQELGALLDVKQVLHSVCISKMKLNTVGGQPWLR